MIIAAPKIEPIRKKLEKKFYSKRRVSSQEALTELLDDKCIHDCLRSVLTSTHGLALGLSRYIEQAYLYQGCTEWTTNYLIYGFVVPDNKTELFIAHVKVFPNSLPWFSDIYLRDSFFGLDEEFGIKGPLRHKDNFSGWPSARKLLVQAYTALENPEPRMLDFAELSLRMRDTRIDIRGLEKATSERVDLIEYADYRDRSFGPFRQD